MQYDRQITVTVGASRKAVLWQPQTMLLSELYTRLGVPARGAESILRIVCADKHVLQILMTVFLNPVKHLIIFHFAYLLVVRVLIKYDIILRGS